MAHYLIAALSRTQIHIALSQTADAAIGSTYGSISPDCNRPQSSSTFGSHAVGDGDHSLGDR
jgi:hypothetical protein